MNRERFEQILDAYGADPRRWPVDERAAAEAFLAAQGAAEAAALSEARQIDALLDAARDSAPVNELLAARILAGARARRSQANWRPILALAACAVFGVLIGFGGAKLAPATDSADAALSAAFDFDGGEG